MNSFSGFLVIDSRVLPEIYNKVLEVKKLIAGKQVKSLAEACKISGISRSAYYKYKDYIFSYEEKYTQRILTFYAVLQDRAGVLANVLSFFYSIDANILTLNQCIPVDSVATVTVSLKLNSEKYNADNIKSGLAHIDGVVDVRVLNRE
ncbi:MAG: ACT domain-containing protein [Oscillospiraceae bacterium]|nr:ACT domain-containing protein [Oscillospiraceae bacterium]